MTHPKPSDAATPVVSAFYDRFPFPGDPLQDGPPPGYNWRWCHRSVLAAVHGSIPAGLEAPRILDAGCGTGVSTDYLCHLNPGADVLGVDISDGALAVARERCQRSGAAEQVTSLRQEQRSLLDLSEKGSFDYINSVGVLHHLDQPGSGAALPGGSPGPVGSAASLSLRRCRSLGDPPHPESAKSSECRHRLGGPASGARAVRDPA